MTRDFYFWHVLTVFNTNMPLAYKTVQKGNTKYNNIYHGVDFDLGINF